MNFDKKVNRQYDDMFTHKIMYEHEGKDITEKEYLALPEEDRIVAKLKGPRIRTLSQTINVRMPTTKQPDKTKE